MKKLIDAKKLLYSLLLDIEPDNLTMTEVNIMFELSKDKDIQGILEGAIDNNFKDFDFEVFNFNKSNIKDNNCMHDNCPECHGTGLKVSGGGCIHYISCTCAKCNPHYINLTY